MAIEWWVSVCLPLTVFDGHGPQVWLVISEIFLVDSPWLISSPRPIRLWTFFHTVRQHSYTSHYLTAVDCGLVDHGLF